MSFESTLNAENLTRYVARQCSFFFPDSRLRAQSIKKSVDHALMRVEHCFSRARNKYFREGDRVRFNHLNTDQYTIFLYLLSNSLWRLEGDQALAGKCYYLNKALHAFDAFYEVELPSVFLVVHPVGTVLGRGSYADYFVCYQRVTVGANLANEYPTFSSEVVLFGGATVIGRCSIGRNTMCSTGSILMDTDVPEGRIVAGRFPTNTIHSSRRSVREQFFLREDEM